MAISTEDINTLELFFNSGTIPNVIKLNEAVTISNADKFVKDKIALMKNPDVADLIKRVRWDDLLIIKRLIEEGKPNTD